MVHPSFTLSVSKTKGMCVVVYYIIIFLSSQVGGGGVVYLELGTTVPTHVRSFEDTTFSLLLGLFVRKSVDV